MQNNITCCKSLE